MRASFSMVLLVAKRELRDQLRDWRIIFPMIVLTVFFPFLMNYTARAALDFTAEYGTPLIGERLVPFFLMVVGFFPITVSLVIALEAFVGEKERGTIEPLLSSPMKDWELFVGKLLAASGGPILTAYLGITVYLLGLVWQGIPLPDINRLIQTIALTGVQAVLMVSGAMVLSTQATSVRGANLLASFIVIPMALLIQGEAIMMFWGNHQILWLAVVAVALMAALIVRLGVAHFQREALLGREIDVLNLRWMGRTFWKAFRGQATSLWVWYQIEVGGALRRIKVSILVLLVLGIFGIAAGYIYTSVELPSLLTKTSQQDVRELVQGVFGAPMGSDITFQFIWGHNLQAVALISLLGLFSFGVLGVLSYVINMGVIGAVLGAFQVFGYSPVLLALAGILPHGIFELTALTLAAATVLYIGALLVKPDASRTLGEVLLEALADMFKILLAVVVPLLTVAAVIETYLTPTLLALVMK